MSLPTTHTPKRTSPVKLTVAEVEAVKQRYLDALPDQYGAPTCEADTPAHERDPTLTIEWVLWLDTKVFDTEKLLAKRDITKDALTAAPYDWGDPTWAEVVAYITHDRTYSRYNEPTCTNTFNVKAYPDCDSPQGEHTLDPAYDDLWDEHINSRDGQYTFDRAYERARMNAEEWTPYFTPAFGPDHPVVGFAGRSGGYVCLEVLDRSKGSFEDAFDEIFYKTDEALLDAYLIMLCADCDFTSQNATRGVEWHLNDLRHEWEQEQNEEQEEQGDEECHAKEDQAETRPAETPNPGALASEGAPLPTCQA